MTVFVGPLSGRTVLYGGSFDPPHLGHQMACLTLLEGLGASAVWLLPSFSHPFGKNLTDFSHRMAMCRLMAAPWGERVQVHETERQLGGQGRTYDLVVHLKDRYPDVHFALAIGADVVADTPRWYRWDALAALVHVVVIGRAGYTAEAVVTPPLPPVASHTLRAAAAAGALLVGQVPLQVAAYIAEQGLYRA